MRERPPCGAFGGYDAHYRRGEDACEPCRAAAAMRMRLWRAEHRGAEAANVAKHRFQLTRIRAAGHPDVTVVRTETQLREALTQPNVFVSWP